VDDSDPPDPYATGVYYPNGSAPTSTPKPKSNENFDISNKLKAAGLARFVHTSAAPPLTTPLSLAERLAAVDQEVDDYYAQQKSKGSKSKEKEGQSSTVIHLDGDEDGVHSEKKGESVFGFPFAQFAISILTS